MLFCSAYNALRKGSDDDKASRALSWPLSTLERMSLAERYKSLDKSSSPKTESKNCSSFPEFLNPVNTVVSLTRPPVIAAETPSSTADVNSGTDVSWSMKSLSKSRLCNSTTNWLMNSESSLLCKRELCPLSYRAFISRIVFKTYSKSMISAPFSDLLVMDLVLAVGAPITNAPSTEAYVNTLESFIKGL